MESRSISTNEFWKTVKAEMEKAASDHGWNTSKAQDRGFAFQLGYSNPPAFTRAFRRLTGESPTTYQARVLQA